MHILLWSLIATLTAQGGFTTLLCAVAAFTGGAAHGMQPLDCIQYVTVTYMLMVSGRFIYLRD